MRIPALCQNCGLVFPNAGINVGLSARIQVQGSTDQCPGCGQPAPIMEGTFDIFKDTIDVLRSGDLTMEMLDALGIVHRDLRDKKITRAQATEQINQIAPKVSKQVLSWLDRSVNYLGVMVACAVLAITMIDRGSNQEDMEVMETAWTEAVAVTEQISEPRNRRAVAQAGPSPTFSTGRRPRLGEQTLNDFRGLQRRH